MQYVGGAQGAGCVFCDALAADDDAVQLILLRGTRAFIILNLYPYNSGHAMVVPYAHAAQLDALDSATRAELMELATDFSSAARRVLRCAGFNLGVNLGDVAGAGVAEHLHLHVVPRWLGDANFMPLLAGTTVMPELLPVTYARLRAELERQRVERQPGGIAHAGVLALLPDGRVVLRCTAGGEIVIPSVNIWPDETASDAALRAARDLVGLPAQVAGWAGNASVAGSIAEPQRSSILIAVAAAHPAAPFQLEPDALCVALEKLVATLTGATSQAIAVAALPVMRRLMESNS